MPPRRLRPALLAAIAALLLAAGLAPAQASASEDSGESAEGGTITTVLHPGWNMVGWVGPETPTRELFDSLPELRRVSAWDASEGTYRRAFRGRYTQLPSLTPGMGLWFHVGGDETVEWTRAATPDGVVIRLQAGLNLVGVVADGAMTPPAGAEARAWRWDPSRQEYERYRFEDATLSRGEALWIEAVARFNLWQPGTEVPPFVFLGDVPTENKQAILGEYEKVRRFFAEHFAVATRGRLHYIGVTVDDIRSIYRAVFGGDPDPRPEFCGRTTRDDVTIMLSRCVPPEDGLDWEYVDTLMFEIPGRGLRWRGEPRLDPRGPGWLIEGAHAYLRASYQEAVGQPPTLSRGDLDTAARRIALPLSHFEVTENRDGLTNGSEQALGFFAIEWLTDRAGDPAISHYLRLVRTSDDWRAAFETAFSISVDDFYEAFAAHRAAGYSPLPHLTDDLDEPVLVFLSGVSAETETAIRSEFENVRRFFAERFGAEARNFTLYVAKDADEALAAVPGWHDAHHCRDWPLGGLVVLTQQWCGDTFPLDYVYIGGILRELVSTQPIPPSGVAHGWAPTWFDRGAVQYAEVAYGEATGALTPGEFHGLAAAAAIHVPVKLDDLVDPSGAREAGAWITKALGFLAVEWLANHAGDPAVFEYYRVLPSSTSREAAFESAFGLTIEDFYEQFAAHRADVAPPLADLSDEIVRPVVVFLGDVPAETRASIQKETDGFYTILTERFGADPFEYTVYVGSDAESITEVYLRLSGPRPGPRSCTLHEHDNAAMVGTLECYEAFPHALMDWVLDAARAQLAPLGSLPPAEEDHDRRGPWWLVRGTKSYTKHVYLATTGEGAPEPPQNESAFADPSALQPLSSMETTSALHAARNQVEASGFLAVEWLANHAGDPAVFEYYRLLPSSSSWQAAFEQAFGLTIEDFYERFEAYRAELAAQ